MKRIKKYGKVIVPLLILFVLALVAIPLMRTVEATPINNVDIQLGAFTGPETGAAQDDNIKASLDLAHTDLDSIIANQDKSGTSLAGDVYTVSMSAVMTGNTDQMFTVTTGRIEILSLFGECTTVIAGSPGDMTIQLDATTGADYDRHFSTTVTVDALGLGDVVRFTSAIDEGVLDLTANVGAGQTLSWFCSPGEIEQTLTSTGTGAVKWYMTYRVLEAGATVTAN